MALKTDPDSQVKVIGFEDNSILVAFDDGEEAFSADILMSL